MAKRNKMVEGMVIGAVLGAAISLVDKETREQFLHTSKRVGKKCVDVMKNPQGYTELVKDQFNVVRSTIEQVAEDVRIVTSKVNEIVETTPEIVETVKETKNTISNKMEVIRDDNIER
ncbi:YtxH domain-containing protein [Bacillus timonensis]|uniref:YtxH domain-containing protein n=1 Tax=Bacillus timonensis TaxID=1033734 RepID=UPI0002893A98|nr:YtxH domain-containing protein [Bacillus timonensis]